LFFSAAIQSDRFIQPVARFGAFHQLRVDHFVAALWLYSQSLG
jgi:hypothetical protein